MYRLRDGGEIYGMKERDGGEGESGWEAAKRVDRLTDRQHTDLAWHIALAASQIRDFTPKTFTFLHATPRPPDTRNSA